MKKESGLFLIARPKQDSQNLFRNIYYNYGSSPSGKYILRRFDFFVHTSFRFHALCRFCVDTIQVGSMFPMLCISLAFQTFRYERTLRRLLLKRVVRTHIGVFVAVYYLFLVSFTQEKIHYISCFSCDSRDMYNDCVCIYTLYMADYFLVLIFTDVLMIQPQRTGLVLISPISPILYYVYLYIYFAVWIL